MLREHFTKGTEKTNTGGNIGLEIETDFLMADGIPMTFQRTQAILKTNVGRPKVCQQKLELGRQKIELSIDPQPNLSLLFEAAEESLAWLYKAAAVFNSYPVMAPDFIWKGENLLWVQEERDEIWVNVDGRQALENLCRCSSVQFTVDVHPEDAIGMINNLWRSRLHMRDYAINNARWVSYIKQSHANYRADRYAGPEGFEDIQDYVQQLNRQRVVMHKGSPVLNELMPENILDLNIDLFLRSVWWNYRLRRFGNTLALEMRPFARRKDEDIPVLWKSIAEVIGL